ncbi:MAG: F0F1 ATP synthase subunit A [Dehalococcoidia bacterium]
MKGSRWIWIIGIVVAIGLGFLLFKGPIPEVVLPSEDLFTIGPWAVRNTVFTSWVVIAFLGIMAYLSSRKTSLVPVRFLQNFVESVIEWAYGIVEGVAGEPNARRFFPIVATIFFYVVCSNWFGLLPIYGTIGLAKTPEVAAGETKHAVQYKKVDLGPLPFAYEGLRPKAVDVTAGDAGQVKRVDGQPLATDANHSNYTGTLVPIFRSVFSDANAPLSIALVSFFVVEYWGISVLGLGTYLGKFFNFKLLLHGNPAGLIDVFVGLLELISELIRIISFTFRLLGNIFAGEVLLGFMTFLVPFFIPTIFYGLELFVGFIQASVFALLTLVFAVMAVEHHGEEHEAQGHGTEQLELEPA